MIRPLRILYYNTFLPMNAPEGMVSRQFLAAAHTLEGWEMTVVPSFQLRQTPSQGAAPRRHKQYMPASLRQSMRALLSPISPYPIGPYLHAKKMRPQLAEAVQQNDPFDMMFLHLSQGDLGVLSELVEQIDLPLVLRVPAPLAYEADQVLHRHMSKADRQRELTLYRKADAILVISDGMKQILCAQGVPADKIFVYPNGVDFSTFTVEEGREEQIRQQLGLNNSFVVGYVGSFWPGNDMRTLFKAWQRVEAIEETAVLLLVGEGALTEQYKQLSKQLQLKNCRWVGRVPHVDVPNYIAVMNAGVGPYTKEAVNFVSPLKVMEYAAIGRPVVATNGGQIKALIQNGVTGYTYTPHDVDELVGQMLELISKPEKAEVMGQQAKTWMETWYSWDKIAQDILSLCQSIVAKKSFSNQNVRIY